MRKSGWFVGAAAGGLVGVVSMSGQSACTIAGACDFSSQHYCDPASAPSCHGHLIDPYTWESNALEGDWLDFPGERAYYMHLGEGTQELQGEIYEVVAYIGTSTHPIADSTKFTVAGGNLAEWSLPGGPWVYVQNDTCASYTLRVVVRAAPASVDASTDASGDVTKD